MSGSASHACVRAHTHLLAHTQRYNNMICQARPLLNCFALEHMIVLYAFIVVIFSLDIALCGHGMDIALLLILFS